MIRSLLQVRFKALFAGLTRQGKQKKKSGKGMVALLIFVYLYAFVVLFGAMGLLFFSLAEPYHLLGLDWLYFAMAGLMGLGFAVIGSVFTTQSQLYDAKDNDMLLAMPIPPRMILLSRMVPLLGLNLLFAGIVMIPATVVYALFVEFSAIKLLLQIMALLAVTVLAQAIACGLGWLLHLLLTKLNKSFASMLYLVVFMVVYFSVYSQAGDILNSMAANADAIAASLKTWVWPLYAMGMGSSGKLLLALAFAAICFGLFLGVYYILSVTFLRSATARKSGRKRRLDMAKVKAGSSNQAIIGKELKRFLGTPVYLTNMGIGLIFVPALMIAGLVFRNTLMAELGGFAQELMPYIPLIIAALLAFTGSMICISTPSISLEGKQLWILKSLPVSAKQILLAKLNFHCIAAAPITFIAGFVLGLGYGCGILDSLLAGLAPALLTVLSGILGLICDLKWARLDWISEAYPCKQSVPVLIVMLGMMGVPVVFGAGYLFIAQWVSPTAFLALSALLLILICLGLYKALMTWGVKKWEQL